MPASLTLGTARSRDGELVLTVSGEIDLSNVATFDDALTTAVTDSGATLTVDLSGVESSTAPPSTCSSHPPTTSGSSPTRSSFASSPSAASPS